MIRDAPVLDDAAPEDAHHIEHVDSESATAWRMVLLPASHVSRLVTRVGCRWFVR
jgi:hypothetical protein